METPAVSPCRFTAAIALALTALAVPACGPNGRHNPDNEVPFGYVDQPKAGDTVAPGALVVGGWALDDSAVKEVRVYLDGRYVTRTTIAVARPDLVKPYPGYLHGTDLHGWNTEIELPDVPGPHTLLVQAEDDAGATRDLGSMTITVSK
jgi:hypothetical protein